MHQSVLVPVSTGPENSGAYVFLVCKALLNDLNCGDRFIAKSFPKAPAPWGQFLFPRTVFSLLQTPIIIIFLLARRDYVP